MSCEIEFLGGAGTVTGSKYLLRKNGIAILVDCGLFQGIKGLRLKNWDGFPIEAKDIHAVILTHAHIDHSGFIPRLIKKGFCGKIYSTAATKDLCKILLPDSGHLMEEEAEFLNRKKKSKHSPALPLFTFKEAEAALDFFETVPFHQKISLSEDIRFEFRYSGHILGAASIILEMGSVKVGFTGDVGRLQDPIFYPPENLPKIDYLITESTYGNRLHKNVDILDELEVVIKETVSKGGVILIPSFAVGRAQALMHSLWKLRKEGRIPKFPMYLNSPMATNVNSLLHKYKDLHRLSEVECREVCEIVDYVRTVEESKSLNERKGPMLIISASGMVSGGRVLHHIKAFAGDLRNTILLAGFQAAGTRGEALEKGAEEIKIHGEYVPIKAQVKVLDNVSAHADYREMIKWLGQGNLNPKEVYVTHGEASASDEFRRRLTETFGWKACVPDQGQKVILR